MSIPRTIILTDIHGCNATLRVMLEQLNPQAGDVFCFLGDYIDRGPDSKGVIDTIWELEKQVAQVVCLLGNHEEKLLSVWKGDQEVLKAWLHYGGANTLKSFNAESISDIPEKYLKFFATCPTVVALDDLVLVHAGLNFKHHSNDPFSDERMMRWIRNWYKDIDYKWLAGRTIFHGHTPLPLEEVKILAEKIESNQYMNLDTGCVYNHPGLGFLSAYDWTNKNLISIPRVKV